MFLNFNTYDAESLVRSVVKTQITTKYPPRVESFFGSPARLVVSCSVANSTLPHVTISRHAGLAAGGSARTHTGAAAGTSLPPRARGGGWRHRIALRRAWRIAVSPWPSALSALASTSPGAVAAGNGICLSNAAQRLRACCHERTALRTCRPLSC